MKEHRYSGEWDTLSRSKIKRGFNLHTLAPQNVTDHKEIAYLTQIDLLQLWEFNTQYLRNKLPIIFCEHHLAAGNNDCSRLQDIQGHLTRS